MRNMSRLTALAVVTTLSLLQANSAAAVEWYLGLAGGSTSADHTKLETGFPHDEDPLILRGVKATRYSEDHGAWKGLVGVRFARPVALEVSYADYGTQSIGFTADQINTCMVPVFCVHETRDAQRSMKAAGVDAVFHVPIHESVDLIGSLGLVLTKVKLNANYTNTTTLGTPVTGGYSLSVNSFASRASLGADWKPAPQWVLRLNYEWLEKSGTDFQLGRLHDSGESGQKTLWFTVMKIL